MKAGSSDSLFPSVGISGANQPADLDAEPESSQRGSNVSVCDTRPANCRTIPMKLRHVITLSWAIVVALGSTGCVIREGGFRVSHQPPPPPIHRPPAGWGL